MKVYVEHLYHLSCAKCKKWWIGDAPKDRIPWSCPWCGSVNQVEDFIESGPVKEEQIHE